MQKIHLSQLVLSVFISGLSSIALAAPSTPSTAEKQFSARQQQQQTALDAEIQAQQVQNPNVHLESEKTKSVAFPVNEAPCFPINQLVLTDFNADADADADAGADADVNANANADTAQPANAVLKTASKPLQRIQPSRFSWALQAAYAEGDFALPVCIGSQGINVLLRRIQNQLIDDGFVTTRVVVAPQDLRSGRLVLTVIPGKVGRIQLQDRSAIPFATRGTLWFAMPIAQGDILNVRDIEQGLENLKRVPSAESDIELTPTDSVGETDVVIQYKQSLPFHLTLGLDDAGTKTTGRLQGSATFSWDNALRLNDLF